MAEQQERGFMSDMANMGADKFGELFGEGGEDQDGWLHERGSALGDELMAKLVGGLYSSNGIEAPADEIQSRSVSTEDIVTNSGLGSGTMGTLMKPLIDGLLSCMQSPGMQAKLGAFAQAKATQLLGANSEALTAEGTRMGGFFLEQLTSALAADHSAEKIEEASRDLGDMEPQVAEVAEVTSRDIAEVDRGLGSDIISAVMGPVTRGLKTSFMSGDTANRVIGAVMSAVPIDTVKDALKGNLLPHYETACRSISPQLDTYGGKAGMMVIKFLQGVAAGDVDGGEEKQRELAGVIARDEASSDHSLMAPVFEPFMGGMINTMSQGGWKTEAAVNALKGMFF